MLMKVCRAGWRYVWSRLSWDGQICWIVVWSWCALCTVVYIFLTQLPRVCLSLFRVLIWWNESVIWQTEFIGKFHPLTSMFKCKPFLSRLVNKLLNSEIALNISRFHTPGEADRISVDWTAREEGSGIRCIDIMAFSLLLVFFWRTLQTHDELLPIGSHSKMRLATIKELEFKLSWTSKSVMCLFRCYYLIFISYVLWALSSW